MELIDDLASDIIERRHGENTYEINFNGDVRFSEYAQDEYTNLYDQIETLCENFYKLPKL